MAYRDADASLSAMAMSFLILIVLISSEMIMPLAAINFTNTEVIRDFERECTLIEQRQQFFESAAPLGDCTRPWSHGMQCQTNQCFCRGGVHTFGQFAELERRLLSSDNGSEVKAQLRVDVSDLNTSKGMKFFNTLFGLKPPDTMRAVFGIGNSSGEQRGNLLFGGRGI